VAAWMPLRRVRRTSALSAKKEVENTIVTALGRSIGPKEIRISNSTFRAVRFGKAGYCVV
jgi:hypothetical protein